MVYKKENLPNSRLACHSWPQGKLKESEKREYLDLASEVK